MPSTLNSERGTGIPPLSANMSPIAFVSHSPENPGNRRFPVSNSCIAPCLICRFLAISASSDSISASASLNASAMACCSAVLGGSARMKSRTSAPLRFG